MGWRFFFFICIKYQISKKSHIGLPTASILYWRNQTEFDIYRVVGTQYYGPFEYVIVQYLAGIIIVYCYDKHEICNITCNSTDSSIVYIYFFIRYLIKILWY